MVFLYRGVHLDSGFWENKLILNQTTQNQHIPEWFSAIFLFLCLEKLAQNLEQRCHACVSEFLSFSNRYTIIRDSTFFRQILVQPDIKELSFMFYSSRKGIGNWPEKELTWLYAHCWLVDMMFSLNFYSALLMKVIQANFSFLLKSHLIYLVPLCLKDPQYILKIN